jgi:hypothetical protein
MFLNLKFQPCTQPDAVFESISSKRNRNRLNPERTMDIRFYDSDLFQKAGTVSQQSPVQPVGRGTPGQVMDIHGRKFEWNTKAKHWFSDRLTNTVLLYPTADRSDTEKVIREIGRIESTILARGLAGREIIQFHIGGQQADPENPKVASAVDFAGKHVHLYSFGDNDSAKGNPSHIVASKLVELGCPLENVILHEIGHLLEPLLEYNIPRMERTFSKGILECRSLLESISPQYLGKQYEGIIEQLRTLNMALRDGSETLLVGPKMEKVQTIHYHADWIANATREITAECIREFYLKPCLSGLEPIEEKTGWNELDELLHRLCREARITMKREPTELFPERRKTRQPQLIETIQDMLQP